MAEMEKEGRPPENKRSRKPAHPVKREINEEMKVGARDGEASGGVPCACVCVSCVPLPAPVHGSGIRKDLLSFFFRRMH